MRFLVCPATWLFPHKLEGRNVNTGAEEYQRWYTSKRQNAANQQIAFILQVSASSKSKILMVNLLKYLILLQYSSFCVPLRPKLKEPEGHCQLQITVKIAWAKSAAAYHSDLYHMLHQCSTSRSQHFFYLHKEYSESFKRSAKRPCNKVIYLQDHHCDPF